MSKREIAAAAAKKYVLSLDNATANPPADRFHPLGMANRMRLRMWMDSQSQSHALSRGGCVLQRSCLSSLAAGQTGGGCACQLS